MVQFFKIESSTRVSVKEVGAHRENGKEWNERGIVGMRRHGGRASANEKSQRL